MSREGFEGTNRLQDKLEAYKKRLVDNVDNAIYQGGLKIEGDAKLLVIVDTGHLRASIATRLIKEPGRTIVEVGSNLEYAAVVEFGSSPHRPPIEVLEPWVLRVILRGDEAYDGEAKDIAYAVAGMIAKWGTVERPFLDPAFQMNYKNIKLRVISAVKKTKGELKD